MRRERNVIRKARDRPGTSSVHTPYGASPTMARHLYQNSRELITRKEVFESVVACGRCTHR